MQLNTADLKKINYTILFTVTTNPETDLHRQKDTLTTALILLKPK